MLSGDPFVSIIMPVFNADRFVGQAIDSILNQSYKHFELLICDDASTDNTLNVIRSCHDRRIRLFGNESNRGSLLTRNFLFYQAKGELIALQDADDFSDPDRILKQVRRFKHDRMLQLCGTWARYKRNSKVLKHKKTPVSWEDVKQNIRLANSFCSASIMFRTSVLKKVEPYREYFKSMGNYDYDFTSRIAEQYPSINIPEYLYTVTIQPQSSSRVKDLHDVFKLESENIVKTFIRERSIRGIDALYAGDDENIRRIEQDLLAPYRLDSWLIYDRVLNYYLALALYPAAFSIVRQALWQHPLSWKPYKLLLYALRRFLYEHPLYR